MYYGRIKDIMKITEISKDKAAKIMKVSVKYFMKKYSPLLADIGLGQEKIYHKEEVEELRKNEVRKKTNHEKDKAN